MFFEIIIVFVYLPAFETLVLFNGKAFNSSFFPQILKFKKVFAKSYWVGVTWGVTWTYIKSILNSASDPNIFVLFHFMC